MTSLGIVVPAYRPDVDGLRQYLETISEELEPDQLHVELDASTQDTVDELSDTPATINHVRERRGKGEAVTAGFERLDTDILAFVDADGAVPATSFGSVIEAAREDDADLSVGSRRHPDADILSHQTVVRRFLGNGFAWLAGRLLDVRLHDYQCGAKAITAEAWNDVREYLYEPGFGWDIELVAVAHAQNASIREIPIKWTDKPDSTVSTVRTPLELFRTLLAVRFRVQHRAGQGLLSALVRPPEESASLIHH